MTIRSSQREAQPRAYRGDRRRPGRALLRRARPSSSARPTRSPSGSATPPDDTFGFGVVFSDETLGGIEHADAAIHQQMEREFARWDDIDVHYRGNVITSGGHGFAAMSRAPAARDPAGRCRELGVTLHFRTEAPDVDELSRTYDLVIASDGLNSAIRAKYADMFRPDARRARRCKYMWLGTDKVFDAFKFDVHRDAVRRHADPRLPVRRDRQHVHRRDARRRVARGRLRRVRRRATFRPGRERREVDRAGAGAVRRRPRRPRACWRTTRGGSASRRSATRPGGTATSCCSATPRTPRTSRSARARSWRWRTRSRWPPACTSRRRASSSARSPRTRRSAGRSCCPPSARRRRASSGSRTSGQYIHQEPEQFAFNIMTRSRRVTYDNLRLRDPEFVERVDAWFADHERRARRVGDPATSARRCSSRSGCASSS